MQFHKKQLEAIKYATDLNNYFRVFINGGAGVGKTAVILEIIKRLYKNNNVVVLSPTNQALKNIISNIDDEDILNKVSFSTLHKYYKLKPIYNFNSKVENRFLIFDNFEDDIENNPQKIVILEECSMIGSILLSKTLEKEKPNKVILVGDLNQLPPVNDSLIDWRNYVNKVITLTHNYRVANENIRKIVKEFETTKQSSIIYNLPIANIDKSNVNDFKIIAYKNKTLSNKMKNILGRDYLINNETALLHAPIIQNGMTIFHNGDMIKIGNHQDLDITKTVLNFDKFIQNNLDFLEHDLKNILNSLLTIFQDKINEIDYKSIKLNKLDLDFTLQNANEINDMAKKNIEKFGLFTISGNYETYEKINQLGFTLWSKFNSYLVDKYKLKNANAIKTNLNLLSINDLNYFKYFQSKYFYFKFKPYVRHTSFITTYKAQGQSINNVVVCLDVLEDLKHSYIAISRARNKLYILP
jgi:hypothetical protein